MGSLEYHYQGDRFMRCLTQLFIITSLLSWQIASVYSEEVKVYTWTDDQGVVHFGDRPPKDIDYETRAIDDDANLTSAPDISRTGGSSNGQSNNERSSSSTSGTDADQDTNDIEAAASAEEQDNLDGNPDIAVSGETASGSSTATTGATGSTAGTATGGATATGASLPATGIGP